MREVLTSWDRAIIGVVGGGLLGSRLAPEIVRSGASVLVFDPELVSEKNLAIQAFVEAGALKVDAIVASCEGIRPGSARGFPCDVRAASAALLECDVVVDCTDDPDLKVHLTKVSNGLALPLLRVAVDGTGELDFGRVTASHAGGGHSCLLCSASLADLVPRRRRTPCPGMTTDPGQPPTLAGSAIAMAITGIGLLQLQRIVGGTDAERALGRELMLDLSHGVLLDVGLPRCEECVSGHRNWGPVTRLEDVDSVTLADLFTIAGNRLQTEFVALEPLGQTFSLGAVCDAGHGIDTVAVLHSPAPRCETCGGATHRRRDVVWPRLTRSQARAVGILDLPLAEIGLLTGRAVILAHTEGQGPIAFAQGAPTRPFAPSSEASTSTHQAHV